MDATGKARENRARRAAERQGKTLRKSARRDPLALDFGGYWLLSRGRIVVGGKNGVSLEQIERELGIRS